MTTFRRACDAAGLTHGQALPLMVFRLAGNAQMVFFGALHNTLGRKHYAIRTYEVAVNWIVSKNATHATMTNAYHDIVGGSAIALLLLVSSDLRATQCGAPRKPQPKTWNGRSGIWRHRYSVGMACPTAKKTRIKLVQPSPKNEYHCNDALSQIQEGRRPRCT